MKVSNRGANMTNKRQIQKITPFLWLDKEAGEAAKLYTSIFKGSKVKDKTTLHDTPSGTVEIVTIEILGQSFTLTSAGPSFKLNPSISFHVICKSKEEVDLIWGKLSDAGTVLMDLGEYPFSERYGWVQDKYGLSWQIILFGDGSTERKITPVLMFVGDVCGKAEEAINFYTSVFHHAKVNNILRYGNSEEPDKAGTIKYAAFNLEGKEFGALDSAHKHNFTFNEALSFVVDCETQEEVDYYWERLSADPRAEQCGWLKDKYGLSWQIVPAVLIKMLQDKDPKKVARVTEAFLKMRKFNIENLKRAYAGAIV